MSNYDADAYNAALDRRRKALQRPHRTCAQCGTDQYRKKVWAWHGKKVLCMTCGQRYAFWLDGSVYDMTTGPSPEQKAQREQTNETKV